MNDNSENERVQIFPLWFKKKNQNVPSTKD